MTLQGRGLEICSSYKSRETMHWIIVVTFSKCVWPFQINIQGNLFCGHESVWLFQQTITTEPVVLSNKHQNILFSVMECHSRTRKQNYVAIFQDASNSFYCLLTYLLID